MNRAPATSILSALLAVGLVAAAVLSLSGTMTVAAEWALLLAGLLVALLALKIHHSRERMLAQMDSKTARIDELTSRIDEHQAMVDSLADRLDVAIFICDAKGMVLFANRRVRDLFRFENPVGKTLLAVTLSHELEDLAAEVRHSGQEQNAEVTFTYPEERTALVKAWKRPGSDPQMFVSIYDVTDLRRLARVRQDFVANVSHELRTPLSIIRAMAETLLDEHEGQNELADQYMRKIIGEVDRLAMITQDLLVLSAAESNPVRKQVCDIADVFRTATNHLKPRADQKGLSISFEGPPSLLIEANTSQMTQVAHNLIENAINYTQEGSIQVSVKPMAAKVLVQVQDTGIGIASEHIERIFERFYRVDKARSRATGGTGLGLSIVRHLIEAHGGFISVDSNLNQGTTFSLSLPIGKLAASDAAQPVEPVIGHN